MKTIHYSLQDGIATLLFDEPNSAVNTMCQQWKDDLTAVVQQVLADRAQLKGLVLASAKSTFFAGADLKGTMRLQASDAPQVFKDIEQVKKNFRTLETLGIPVVTCLNGTALGGGWELALVGHHRIAVDSPKIQLGLPEITLGLIPGASGITKMTRLLGLMGAQPYVLESKLFTPSEGHALGLVHELVADASALRERALAFIAAHPTSMQPWDDKAYKIPGGTPSNPKILAGLAVAPAMMKKKTRGLYPAPEYALNAMVEGAQVDFDTALRIESRYLAKLIVSPVAKNMINTFFFNMGAIRSGASRPKDVPRYKPAKVGILGAGMMGAGIAYAQASRGIATVLKDVSLEKAELGKAYSARLTQPKVEKGRMLPMAQEALLGRIQPTDQASALQGCDLIIEAVFENRALKAQVTQEAEPQLAAGGFFASNTSTLPISGLAQASAKPSKFVGIHFFSPVDKMKLVEIIRGRDTDDETVARAFDYVQSLGKIPIVVNDARGFYTSRTFGTFVMEGAAMLGEGIPAPVIENASMQAGMPVGPLAVLDETALSLSVHVLDQTRAKPMRPPPASCWWSAWSKNSSVPAVRRAAVFTTTRQARKKCCGLNSSRCLRKAPLGICKRSKTDCCTARPLKPRAACKRTCSPRCTMATSVRFLALAFRPGPAAPCNSSTARASRPSRRVVPPWPNDTARALRSRQKCWPP